MVIKQKTQLNEEELQIELQNIDFVFGKYLRAIRKAQGISVRELAKNVKKTATYISDIENGNNKPPERELLEQIIRVLEIQKLSIKLTTTLFDLAAKERGDVSADIAEYIMSNDELRKIIRTVKEKPDNDQIWSQMAKIL